MSTIPRNEDCFFTKSQDSRFEGDNMVCAGVVRVRTKSALVLQTTMELQPFQKCDDIRVIFCYSLHCVAIPLQGDRIPLKRDKVAL